MFTNERKFFISTNGFLFVHKWAQIHANSFFSYPQMFTNERKFFISTNGFLFVHKWAQIPANVYLRLFVVVIYVYLWLTLSFALRALFFVCCSVFVACSPEASLLFKVQGSVIGGYWLFFKVQLLYQ